MASRKSPDPLLSLSRPTWLLVRHRQALERRRLAPGLDLRSILRHERENLLAASCATLHRMTDDERAIEIIKGGIRNL
jgi:hypothetical protein